jgi:DIE2/ALG10 family
VQAAILALFPLVFFFQFLYYTDLPCIVFVLATHLVGLGFRHG